MATVPLVVNATKASAITPDTGGQDVFVHIGSAAGLTSSRLARRLLRDRAGSSHRKVSAGSLSAA
jgi:cold shock CspA family protein